MSFKVFCLCLNIIVLENNYRWLKNDLKGLVFMKFTNMRNNLTKELTLNKVYGIISLRLKYRY